MNYEDGEWSHMTNVHKKRTHTLSIIIFVIFECQLIKDNTELREYSTNIKSKPWIAYIEILSQKINENFWEVSKCLFILNFSGLTPSNIWKIKNLIIINNNTWNSVRYYILSIKTIKTFEKHQLSCLVKKKKKFQVKINSSIDFVFFQLPDFDTGC